MLLISGLLLSVFPLLTRARDNSTVRGCAGVNGSPCIFPFDYYGTVYYACVWQSFIPEGWCATQVDGSGGYNGNWEECNSECPVCKTVDNQECDFPFQYSGSYHHECIDHNGKSSCAVSKAGDLSVEQWGECNGFCPGEFTGGETTSPPSTTTSSPPGPTTEPVTGATSEPGTCGLRPVSSDGKIIGGSEAAENSWPWQVSVQVVGEAGASQHLCGGSIFNYEYVITAAHCVIKYRDQPESLLVVAGEHSLSQEAGTEQRLGVSQVFTREDYDGHDYVNDIALLHLSTPVSLDNQTTNYICLPAPGSDYSHSQPAVIIGWGSSVEGGELSDLLQEAEVTTITDTDCRNTNYNPDFIYDSHLCAGAPGVDGCVGDAGGPLMVSDGGRWVLAGVASWGTGCAREGYPGVYTETQYFTDWVVQVTSENSVPTTTATTSTTTTTTTTTTQDPYPYQCGLRSNSTCGTGRIIDGEQAADCAWPWQAALLEKKGLSFELFCGGAIYNQDWIITTAGCVAGKDQASIEVEVGEWQLTVNDPGEQFRPVAELVLHPEYNQTSGANDIALLRVVPRLSLDGQYVGAVCLPELWDNFTDSAATATGWGEDGQGEVQEFLQQLEVRILSQCGEGQLCASPVGSGSLCRKDEGGPLVVLEEDDHWTLAGLISQPSCGESEQSVYTDLTSPQVLLWLYEVVGDGYGPTTTTPVTTGLPVGPCFTTGSCDATGEEHIGTVYGVESAVDCQVECQDNLYDHGWCEFFTWYGGSSKCRLYTDCLPSGELCPDCVKGPVICTNPVTSPATTEETTAVSTEPAVTTGQPVGECFTTGSCDISGPEHTGTVYGVGSPEDCQAECGAGTASCEFFTWYGDSDKCRLFSDCLPSGEMCPDCVRGPAAC